MFENWEVATNDKTAFARKDENSPNYILRSNCSPPPLAIYIDLH